MKHLSTGDMQRRRAKLRAAKGTLYTNQEVANMRGNALVGFQSFAPLDTEDGTSGWHLFKRKNGATGGNNKGKKGSNIGNNNPETRVWVQNPAPCPPSGLMWYQHTVANKFTNLGNTNRLASTSYKYDFADTEPAMNMLVDMPPGTGKTYIMQLIYRLEMMSDWAPRGKYAQDMKGSCTLATEEKQVSKLAFFVGNEQEVNNMASQLFGFKRIVEGEKERVKHVMCSQAFTNEYKKNDPQYTTNTTNNNECKNHSRYTVDILESFLDALPAFRLTPEVSGVQNEHYSKVGFKVCLPTSRISLPITLGEGKPRTGKNELFANLTSGSDSRRTNPFVCNVAGGAYMTEGIGDVPMSGHKGVSAWWTYCSLRAYVALLHHAAKPTARGNNNASRLQPGTLKHFAEPVKRQLETALNDLCPKRWGNSGYADVLFMMARGVLETRENPTNRVVQRWFLGGRAGSNTGMKRFVGTSESHVRKGDFVRFKFMTEQERIIQRISNADEKAEIKILKGTDLEQKGDLLGEFLKYNHLGVTPLFFVKDVNKVDNEYRYELQSMFHDNDMPEALRDVFDPNKILTDGKLRRQGRTGKFDDFILFDVMRFQATIVSMQENIVDKHHPDMRELQQSLSSEALRPLLRAAGAVVKAPNTRPKRDVNCSWWLPLGKRTVPSACHTQNQDNPLKAHWQAAGWAHPDKTGGQHENAPVPAVPELVVMAFTPATLVASFAKLPDNALICVDEVQDLLQDTPTNKALHKLLREAGTCRKAMFSGTPFNTISELHTLIETFGAAGSNAKGKSELIRQWIPRLTDKVNANNRVSNEVTGSRRSSKSAMAKRFRDLSPVQLRDVYRVGLLKALKAHRMIVVVGQITNDPFAMPTVTKTGRGTGNAKDSVGSERVVRALSTRPNDSIVSRIGYFEGFSGDVHTDMKKKQTSGGYTKTKKHKKDKKDKKDKEANYQTMYGTQMLYNTNNYKAFKKHQKRKETQTSGNDPKSKKKREKLKKYRARDFFEMGLNPYAHYPMRFAPWALRV
jgi:hypothetical protein